MVLVPCVVIFGAAVAVAFMIPPVYRSSATILVESQQIPQDLVRSTVTSSALQRMEVIRQRVMARESVLRMVQKFGLYPDEIASLSATQIVDRFRKAAAIDQVLLADNSRPEAVAFKISFDYGDPVVAAQVANELVSSVLDEDLRSRSGQAAETKRFLTDEVERLQHELNSVEAEIADYKAKHSNFLPETLGYRQSSASGGSDADRADRPRHRRPPRSKGRRALRRPMPFSTRHDCSLSKRAPHSPNRTRRSNGWCSRSASSRVPRRHRQAAADVASARRSYARSCHAGEDQKTSGSARRICSAGSRS